MQHASNSDPLCNHVEIMLQRQKISNRFVIF